MGKARLTAALCGASLLAALAVLRAAGAATPASAFLAGSGLRWPCLFKLWAGLDCPGCGITRGALLALGGDWRAAWALNPGGPLLVIGAALLGAALLRLSLDPRGRDRPAFDGAARGLKLYATAYAAVALAFVLFRWALAFV